MDTSSGGAGSCDELVNAPRENARGDSVNGFGHMIGESASLRKAVQRARLLSQADSAVLLYGETGVGKELFARAIHDNGRDAARPFVAMNCGGLPRELLASELFGYVEGAFTGARRTGNVGKLEAADGGTLFLDEIAEMPLDLQPYLLRALEGGEVCPLGSNKPRRARFRLVSACNRDLQLEVRAGRFRVDLYFRVSATSIRVPPLRERYEDLPELVAHFARLAAERRRVPVKRFDAELLSTLARYAWPGNLRELRNVVEAMVFLTEGEIVDLSALPDELRAGIDQDDIESPRSSTSKLAQFECDTIAGAIRTRRGNLTIVARDLRIARSTLYEKVRRYALERVLQEVRLGAQSAPRGDRVADVEVRSHCLHLDSIAETRVGQQERRE
jgi:transcriptional regulator with PAS, ATPase and Fis domain